MGHIDLSGDERLPESGEVIKETRRSHFHANGVITEQVEVEFEGAQAHARREDVQMLMDFFVSLREDACEDEPCMCPKCDYAGSEE